MQENKDLRIVSEAKTGPEHENKDHGIASEAETRENKGHGIESEVEAQSIHILLSDNPSISCHTTSLQARLRESRSGA